MGCWKMLNPSIGKLLNAYDSRYQLVVDVSRRARRIAEEAERNKIPLMDKPVNLATDELARRKCKDE